MKNILLLLAVLPLTNIAIAQNPNYSIRDSINYVFEELNQTYITTGILYEKASPTLNWELYSNINDTTTLYLSTCLHCLLVAGRVLLVMHVLMAL